MSTPTEDVMLKVLLTLVGAAVGAVVKTVVDWFRLRSLLPLVIDQVERTTGLCERAYALADAQQAELLCESSFKALCELVSLGVRPKQRWRDGAKLLLNTAMAIRAVTARASSPSVAAFDQIRMEGAELRKWLH